VKLTGQCVCWWEGSWMHWHTTTVRNVRASFGSVSGKPTTLYTGTVKLPGKIEEPCWIYDHSDELAWSVESAPYCFQRMFDLFTEDV
jgi:hypothetical protein